jgi:enamine deaminase RidA (YjgF/YER057c/UK114 family)
MKIQYINSENLFPSLQFGFTQVISAQGGRTIRCSGQTAWDKNMKIIGEGDFAAQAKAVYENVRIALASAGAEPGDIVRMRTYIVDYKPEYLEPLGIETAAFFGDHPPPAATLLGVASLAMPEFMIEIEVTAVIDSTE